MTKICRECKIEKTENDMVPSRPGRNDSWCRECKRRYDRNYEKNRSQEKKERKKIYKIKRMALNNKKIMEYLEKHPCVVCGEKDPIVLDFHHLRDKYKNVSEMKGFGLDKIFQEIAKCQVLCANCHRRKTAEQFNWYFRFNQV